MTITYSNIAVTSVFLKRGNTIQNDRYLGLTGEVTVDTQAYTLRIHDGIGTGGHVIQSIPDLSNITSSIIPSANVTYSLGSPTRQWKDIYVSGNTIYMGGTSLSIVNGNLQVGGNTVQGGSSNVANLWNSGKTVSLGTNGITTFPGDIYFNNNSGVIEQGANRLTITGNAIQVNTGAYFNDDGEAAIFALTSVQIATDTNSVAPKTWDFSQAGKLTFPNGSTFDGYDLVASPNSYIEFGGYTGNTWLGLDNNSAFIQTNWNAAQRQWTFDATGNLTFPDNTVQQTAFSNTAPIITVLTANSYQQQALIGNLQASAYSNVNVAALITTNGLTNYSNVNLSAYLGGAVTIGGNLTVNGNLFLNGNTTLLNTNNLIINDNIIYFANANPANSLDIGFVGHFTATRYQHTGLVRQATSGQWQLFSNVTAEPGATIDFTSAVYDDIRVGNITSPTITGINANVTAANVGLKGYIDLANTIQSGQVGAANLAITTANTAMKGYVDSQIFYSNARVATYLQSGNIANISAAGNITATYFVGNGALLTGIAASSNYSNVNVATYLPTYAGNIANIRLGVAGVLTFADGTTQTTAATGGGSSYSNVNVAAYLNTTGYNLYSNTNVIAYLNATGYNLYSNVNVAAYLAGTSYTGYSNVNVNAWFSGNIFTSLYSNVNVASYLAGNITVGTISLTGNVNANNLVGTAANTTITAGAFVSTFNNAGNVILPNVYVSGNVIVGGNLTITGIKNNVPVKAGGFVAQNTAVSMDSITAQWLNTGGASANQLSLAALTGNVTMLYTYTFQDGTGGSTTGGSASTTLANLSFGWTSIGNPSGVAGDMYNVLVTLPGTNAYRITAMTGSGYSNNVLTIERLI